MTLRRLTSASLLASCYAASKFRVSNVFGDDAVLQRDREVIVWGLGTPGASITASWTGSGTITCAEVDASDVWRCTVPSTPAGGPYNFSFASSTGEPSLSMDGILMGDVYVIGGQSNAVFSVLDAFNGTAEAAAATEEAYPTVRLFTVGQDMPRVNQTQQLLYHVSQPWTVVSPASVGGPGNFSYFSAVGWFFGRHLYNKLNKTVPIGLINNNWPGTIIQEWSSYEALSSSGCLQGPNPLLPREYNTDLWSTMIYPYTLGPMALSGVVWYQAESNIDTEGPGFGGDYYGCQFPATITSWRTAFQQPQLPWMFVQLAAYTSKSGNTSFTLPDMREGQLNATNVIGYVWFVTAMDLGDPGSPWTDIHPRLKQPVGQRLADVAAAYIYGVPGITAQGPQYGSSSIVSAAPGYAAVHVSFALNTISPYSPLVLKQGQTCPPSYNASKYCAGFVMVFDDGSAVEVDYSTGVSLDASGTGLTITAPVPPSKPNAVPVYTRYAYAPWPVTSVYTADGWPAIPWDRPVGK